MKRHCPETHRTCGDASAVRRHHHTPRLRRTSSPARNPGMGYRIFTCDKWLSGRQRRWQRARRGLLIANSAQPPAAPPQGTLYFGRGKRILFACYRADRCAGWRRFSIKAGATLPRFLTRQRRRQPSLHRGGCCRPTRYRAAGAVRAPYFGGLCRKINSERSQFRWQSKVHRPKRT
jgi:hypothetical protein